MFFQRGRHLPHADFPERETMRRKNLAEKRALVVAGLAHGILVYNDNQPVGWCQFGPPEELPLRGGGRTARRIPPTGANVRWRITCFVTAVGHRRRGVAGMALRAALSAIRERGGGLVEAYPAVPPIRADWEHGGTIALFAREGFRIVGPAYPPYVVMQRVIRPIERPHTRMTKRK